MLPYRPLREVGDEDAAVVHRVREVEARSDLTEDEPQVRRGRELSGFVQNGRRRFRALLFRIARVLVAPEAQRLGVGYFGNDALPKAIVGVEPRQVKERRMLARDERRDAMEKKMLQPRPPAVGPQMLERRDHAGGGEGPALGRDLGRGIEADGILGLSGIEVAHVIDARGWNGVENVGCEVAVGVDDGNSLPRVDVAHREIEEERRFARTRFADDVDVAGTLLAREHNAAACGGRRY